MHRRPPQDHALALALSILSMIGITAATPASPDAATMRDDSAHTACPSILIDGGSAAPHNVDLVRQGACTARDFFAAHGFPMQRPIRIRLLSEAVENSANHIGIYDARAAQVELFDLPRVRRATRANSPFGVAMDEALYVSFVVHEVAHAIADQHFVPDRPRLLAHEYIAYATQLSSIDEQLRTRILSRYPVQGFANLSELSSIYYGLDPNRFGVKAYLHFRDAPDRRQLLHGLLSGEIRAGGDQTEW